MRASAGETLGCELGRGEVGAEGEEGSGNGGGDCKRGVERLVVKLQWSRSASGYHLLNWHEDIFGQNV